jgi:hypothetical protein
VGDDGNTFAAYSGNRALTFSGANPIGANQPTCNDVPFGTATTLSFNNGIATCTLKLYKAETASINVSIDDFVADGHELGVTVSSAANAFLMESAATVTAGAAFSVTLMAQDTYGNVVADYSGDKSITFSGASAIGAYSPTCTDKSGAEVNFGTATTLNFTDGTASCNMKLYKKEAVTVQATDGVRTAAGPITVAAAGLASFDVTAPALIVNGDTFPMRLSAKDTYGNAAGWSQSTTISASRGAVSPNLLESGSEEYVDAQSNQYLFKKEITLTNNVASVLTGYQTKITLDTAALVSAGNMQADCDDMRFVETDGTPVPYWMESGCNTVSTTVWIKTDLPASAAKTVYFYYGNGSVASAADGNSVFALFDDFNAGSLDASKWDTNTLSGEDMKMLISIISVPRYFDSETFLTRKTFPSAGETKTSGSAGTSLSGSRKK